MRELRFDKDTIRDVTKLIELHLRFHGYGGGEWTDSAVRRYVTDAGSQLARLHLLTRSDCTTRNRRKAATLAATYDDLERRIARLLEQEELGKVRPELDGNQIASVLGIPPGPVLGRAYKHLLAYRLDAGPVGEDAAREELLRWWPSSPSPREPPSSARGRHSRTTRMSPSWTTSPGTTRTSVTVPSHSGTTGISIFIDSSSTSS